MDGSAALKEALRDGVRTQRWELRAVEHVVTETAEDFGGADPLIPLSAIAARQRLLEDLRSSIGDLGEELELEDPSDEAVERIKKLVHREFSDHTFIIDL